MEIELRNKDWQIFDLKRRFKLFQLPIQEKGPNYFAAVKLEKNSLQNIRRYSVRNFRSGLILISQKKGACGAYAAESRC